MKAIQIPNKTATEAEAVAAALGMSAENLMAQSLAAIIHDLKQQLDSLAKRGDRAEANPEAGERVRGLIREGIPEHLRDVQFNRKSLATLITRQRATLAHNQKVLHKVLGLEVNN